MDEEHLKWNSHSETLLEKIYGYYLNETKTDTTLAFSDGEIKGHRVILSAGSVKLENILNDDEYQNNFLCFIDFSKTAMTYLIEFMYRGQVLVPRDALPSVLKAAEYFQVRGIPTTDDLQNSHTHSEIPIPKHNLNDNEKVSASPQNKNSSRLRMVVNPFAKKEHFNVCTQGKDSIEPSRNKNCTDDVNVLEIKKPSVPIDDQDKSRDDSPVLVSKRKRSNQSIRLDRGDTSDDSSEIVRPNWYSTRSNSKLKVTNYVNPSKNKETPVKSKKNNRFIGEEKHVSLDKRRASIQLDSDDSSEIVRPNRCSTRSISKLKDTHNVLPSKNKETPVKSKRTNRFVGVEKHVSMDKRRASIQLDSDNSSGMVCARTLPSKRSLSKSNNTADEVVSSSKEKRRRLQKDTVKSVAKPASLNTPQCNKQNVHMDTDDSSDEIVSTRTAHSSMPTRTARASMPTRTARSSMPTRAARSSMPTRTAHSSMPTRTARSKIPLYKFDSTDDELSPVIEKKQQKSYQKKKTEKPHDDEIHNLSEKSPMTRSVAVEIKRVGMRKRKKYTEELLKLPVMKLTQFCVFCFSYLRKVDFHLKEHRECNEEKYQCKHCKKLFWVEQFLPFHTCTNREKT